MPKHITRPTDYIYAQLAAQVYEANGGANLPNDWMVLEARDNTDIDGYFGAAYVHQETQQIIIAHRGTELPHSNSSTPETEISKIGSLFAGLKDYAKQISNSMKDISTDINGIVRLMITSQQMSALEFALYIQKKYIQKEHSDYTLSFAGHSLGGWLAQICTYHFMVENHYTWCVTLDSPGARDIIEEMHARYLDSIPQSQLGTFLERLDITTYVSSPNLINSCNRHLGSVYRLYVPFIAAEGWFKKTKEALRYNIESHQIVSLLENFDATTGYAKKITHVVDWPQIQWPDSEEVTRLNTSGPVEWLVTQLDEASPIKLPIDLVNFVTRKLDAGVMKLINSSHVTRGFYNIGQVIRDYTSGATDKAEYRGFFEFANNRNQYAPEQDLTFRQHYQLSHQYHYAVKEFDPHYLHLRHMDKPIREFLWAYTQINQNNSFLENSKLPVNIRKDLNAYQLIQGSLIQKKGWALTLKNKPNDDTAWIWCTRVSRYLATYPLLLQTLNQDLRSQAARLHEIAVNVDKINGKIAYIEEQHEALVQRVDALEQNAFSPLSDEDTQKLAVKAKEKLQTHYQGNAKIEGLFGKPMTLDKQYINVQMLYQVKEEKNRDEATSKDTPTEFKDARITSFEDIFSKKQALQISELFLPAKAILKDNQKTNELNPDKPPQFLLIQGRAGIGKTTFVNFVSHEWSLGRLWKEFNWVFSLRLRDLRNHQFTKAYEQGQIWSLSDWVYQIHFAGILNKIEFKSVWELMIAPQLQDKVLFLLDGFDETPTEHPCQQALTDLLNSQIHKIVTSRPYGLSDLTQNKRELEVMGFVDENIEKYVQLYFGEAQENKAKQIITALKANPSLWGNAHIPVTLNILCGVLEKSHDINASMEVLETMSGLYEQMELALFVRAYCNTPQNAATHRKQLKVLDEASKKKLLVDDVYREHRGYLASLALVAFMDDNLIIAPKELNRVLGDAKIPLTERHNKVNDLLCLGLLKPVLGEQQVDDDPIGYEFLHLTFQEYYAGLAIAQQLMQATDENDSQLKTLHTVKFNPRYQIVFWFAAGLLNTQPQAFDRLMKVLNAPQGNDMIGHVKLGLQLCCVHEAWQAAEQTAWLSKIAQGIQNNIKVLYQAFELGVINSDTVVHSGILLLQRLPRWLRATGPYEVFERVDMMSNNKRKMASFIKWLTVRSPKIITSLEQLLSDEDSSVLHSAAKAIGKLGAVAATPEILKRLLQLLSDEDSDVRSSAGWTIGQLGAATATPEILKRLLQLLSDENSSVRSSAAWAIGQLGAAAATPEILKRLLQLLSDENSSVRSPAAEAIGQLGAAAATPEILKGLLQLLSDEDRNVRRSAAGAIGELGAVATTPEILKGLLQLLSDEDSDVRRSAAQAIGKLGAAAATPEFLKGLLQLLSDKDSDVRYYAVEAIGKLSTAVATPEFFKGLLQLLSDKDSEVRCSTAYAIGELGAVAVTPEILKGLLQLLSDEDSEVRSSAATAIGKLGAAAATPEILKRLLQLLSDEDSNVRYSTAKAIGELGAVAATPEMLKALPQLLSDEDKYVRGSAVEAIGKLGAAAATSEILKGLLQLLSDKGVRHSAVEAFGKLGAAAATPEMLKALPQLLSDEDSDVRHSAAETIGKLGAAAATPEILKALLQLLSDKEWHVRHSATEAIGRLRAAAATPEMLNGLLQLLNNKDSDVRDSTATAIGKLGAAAATPEFLVALAKLLCERTTPQLASTVASVSSHYYSKINLQTRLPEQEAKKILLTLLVGSYYSGDVSGGVIWQSQQQQFSWQGFSGEKQFTLLLTQEQARWLIDAAPKIIESINNNNLAEKFAKIEKAKVNIVPSQANAPSQITTMYNDLNNTSSGAAPFVPAIIKGTPSTSKKSCSIM